MSLTFTSLFNAPKSRGAWQKKSLAERDKEHAQTRPNSWRLPFPKLDFGPLLVCSESAESGCILGFFDRPAGL